jgi:hypothetical protein
MKFQACSLLLVAPNTLDLQAEKHCSSLGARSMAPSTCPVLHRVADIPTLTAVSKISEGHCIYNSSSKQCTLFLLNMAAHKPSSPKSLSNSKHTKRRFSFYFCTPLLSINTRTMSSSLCFHKIQTYLMQNVEICLLFSPLFRATIKRTSPVLE